jgi:phage shock protein C
MTTTPDVDDTRRFAGGSTAEPRRLYRSRTNRTLAGVCGGIAEYFGADPTAVRLLTIVIALFTAVVPLLVLYLVAAIVVPERVDDGVDARPAPDGVPVAPGQGGLVIGVVLIAFGAIALVNQVWRVDWDVLWPVALLALGGALVLAARPR